MARISTYPLDSIITDKDIVIGSDGAPENSFQSKNYTIGALKNYILGFVNIPSLQIVVNNGNSILVPPNKAKGIDVTLSDFDVLYQNGFSVTIPPQTGSPYPQYNPAPDAYIANIKGQSPGSLIGSVGGFVVTASGDDNIAFLAELDSTAGNSNGVMVRSYDGHAGNLFTGKKSTSGVISDVFRVSNTGEVHASSFVKLGGASSQFLKADGSVDSTLYAPASGSASYINNQYGSTQNANFKIGGNGILGQYFDYGSGISGSYFEFFQQPLGGGLGGFDFVVESGMDYDPIGLARMSMNPDAGFQLYVSDPLYENTSFIELNTVSAGISAQFVSIASTFGGTISITNNIVMGGGANDGINKVQINGSVKATQYRVKSMSIAPISATATGTIGEIRYTTNHIYVCVAADTWKRSELLSW